MHPFKKWLAIALVLIAGTALAKGYISSSYTVACAAGVCTSSAVPTVASTGLQGAYLKGIRLKVCAPSGSTLSGAGNMEAYLQGADGNIYRNKAIDNAIPTGSATDCKGGTCQCVVFPDQAVYVPLNEKVIYIPNGVTISAVVTPLAITIDGYQMDN